jgi:hypothetical protein|tara:strand:- start:43 stop:294 length:252 start_codon:yes stop_codon:yes gene_type:complete
MMHYEFDESKQLAMQEYIGLRKEQSNLSNSRSICNVVNRIRLREANRLFKESLGDKSINKEKPILIKDVDISAPRIFSTSKSN